MRETVIQLKRGKERKILNLYPWVYRDEVAYLREAGAVSHLYDRRGRLLATGLYSPSSRVIWRFLSLGKVKVDRSFFKKRILEAVAYRKHVPATAYRLVFSESDFLGGLIVDRYNNGLVIQIRSEGMERMKGVVVDALVEALSPSFIYERSDMEGRWEEGLKPVKGPIVGDAPNILTITENGIKFYVDVVGGLKTGFYLDQRRSRQYVASLVKEGFKVLDLFSYSGGFSIYAALKGAKVLAVDTNEAAIRLAQENARLNGVSVSVLVADAFKFLMSDRDTYDLIVADPPAIAKRKDARKSLLGAIWKLTYYSLPRLREGGHLYLCSCSYQASLQDMITYVRFASTDRKIPIYIAATLIQPEDHPFLPHFPESLYLKCLHVVRAPSR
ncbi:MAG: class I SAM-dependent rRNA methyltransferase [Thermotogae bacterium]|nr:class I SAM-dependent rRNA methyltransferase [Thermotogota bacterium]